MMIIFMIFQKTGRNIGEYYYYNPIVKTGEVIDIFKSINIPNDLSDNYVGKKIIVTVYAEAIQSSNFNPDYELEDPWQGVNPEKSLTNTYGVDVKDEGFNVEIKYEKDAEKYIEISKDFFKQLGKTLPGDNVTETVKILNKTDKTVEYFYGIDIPENIEGREKEILEKCNLTVIKNDTETMYSEGLLKHKNNSIGKLNPGEEAYIKFIIKVPEDLNNEFSMLKTKFNWKFSSKPDEIKENNLEKIIKNIANSPKTGDLKFDLSLCLFFISAIVLIIVLFLEHRIKNKINKGK